MQTKDFQAAYAGSVSRETLHRLELFADLYAKWTPRINLTAPSTHGDFWTRHIGDSAQLLELAPDAKHWIDLGSGGGFPGMVVAILLENSQDRKVELVESNRKKTSFLHVVKTQCAPSCVIRSERIEAVVARTEAPDIVTARALAPLPALIEMIAPWARAGARALLHKGRGYAAEIAESRAKWEFDLVEHRSRVDADSVVLEVANLRPALN
ncbi:16S rRNA (guanine(527)-N(7))-methyltransferase RsmG [Oricola cellulosilytica]|uniref:Ribosomal RNA small subunit methyltransferase G n=1 Tax=Oricola cellulosilytica TaxID=1429082 RepID=A0A4R0PFT5_9HYPH|nr:16S rRNA (guanine(527)-N(7))-methyltransferase RsmG [Oricola cellulosilytica]